MQKWVEILSDPKSGRCVEVVGGARPIPGYVDPVVTMVDKKTGENVTVVQKPKPKDRFPQVFDLWYIPYFPHSITFSEVYAHIGS